MRRGAGRGRRRRGPSGCTVRAAPAGQLGAIAVRGQSPGTREAAALGPLGKLEVIHGVVLAGGSAYGLAAADGVDALAGGPGHRLPGRRPAIVPIVGGAIVLDQGGDRPGRAARRGRRAGRLRGRDRATTRPRASVGAGAGVHRGQGRRPRPRVAVGPGHRRRARRRPRRRRPGGQQRRGGGPRRGRPGRSWAPRAGADAAALPGGPTALMRGRGVPAPPGRTGSTAAPGRQATPSSGGGDQRPARQVAGHRVADLAHDGIARAVSRPTPRSTATPCSPRDRAGRRPLDHVAASPPRRWPRPRAAARCSPAGHGLPAVGD